MSSKEKFTVKQRQFACSTCNALFQSKAMVLKHRQRCHCSEYKCVPCNRYLNENEHPKYHLRREHYIEKFACCTCCDWAFASLAEVTEHNRFLRTNEGIPIFPMIISYVAPGNADRVSSLFHVTSKWFYSLWQFSNIMNTNELPLPVPLNNDFPQTNELGLSALHPVTNRLLDYSKEHNNDIQDDLKFWTIVCALFAHVKNLEELENSSGKSTGNENKKMELDGEEQKEADDVQEILKFFANMCVILSNMKKNVQDLGNSSENSIGTGDEKMLLDGKKQKKENDIQEILKLLADICVILSNMKKNQQDLKNSSGNLTATEDVKMALDGEEQKKDDESDIQENLKFLADVCLILSNMKENEQNSKNSNGNVTATEDVKMELNSEEQKKEGDIQENLKFLADLCLILSNNMKENQEDLEDASGNSTAIEDEKMKLDVEKQTDDESDVQENLKLLADLCLILSNVEENGENSKNSSENSTATEAEKMELGGEEQKEESDAQENLKSLTDLCLILSSMEGNSSENSTAIEDEKMKLDGVGQMEETDESKILENLKLLADMCFILSNMEDNVQDLGNASGNLTATEDEKMELDDREQKGEQEEEDDEFIDVEN